MALNSPILIFGAGSIGERHICVLHKLGYTNIWVYRERQLPLRNIDASTINVITDLNLVTDIQPFFAIICTPTALHLKQTLFCIENNIPVLVEKPLSHNLDGIAQLKAMMIEKNIYVQVAYMLRYHPFMRLIKNYVANKLFGNLLNIQSHWGEYLPSWHPWEDYKTTYPARKELGGGAALTLSHDVDLANWLAGCEITKWYNLKNYQSKLDVNVEAGSDISISYANGITAHCHLNFFEKVTRRYYRFIFDEASIEVDYLKNTLNILLSNGKIERNELPNFDRNHMFESQIIDFIANINKAQILTANVDNAMVVVKICS